MSLTSMLKGNDIFKGIMKQSIPSKDMFRTLSGNMPFSNQYTLRIAANLTTSYNSTVVGTAFDYMARFIIAQTIKDNKEKCYENLIAKKGLVFFNYGDSKVYLKLCNKYDNGIKEINKFIFNKHRFISKKAALDNIINVACYYARLEHIYRSGVLPKTSLLENEQMEIVKDLRKLCDVFKESFIKTGIVNENSKVAFNPAFGLCSFICGGADADVFIDGTLYDFKTTINKGYKWTDVAQILGYYILNQIACTIGDSTADLCNFKIDRIAMYKARYGEIEYVDIDTIDSFVLVNAICEIKEHLGIK